MITNTFNQDEGILYSIRTGKISLEELLGSIKEVGTSTAFPRKLLTITDASKSDLEIQPADLKTIMEALKLELPKYESIHDAVIHNDTPNDVAIGVFFEQLSSVIPNYHFRIFTTYEAARRWLLSFR